MNRWLSARSRVALACVVASAAVVLFWTQLGVRGQGAEAAEPRATPGSLEVINEEGETVGLCPLKHTEVRAEISGYVARTTVTQQFHNPYEEKIEAVYTFPLSQNAAVDDMLMKVGERVIRGVIKPREDARRIYEAARARGHVASLLEQERPNIFTQSVANIMPGENVDITLSYVETLKFEDGWFEFVFPTVVGPRYIPGAPTSAQPEVAPEMEGRVVKPEVPEGKGDPSGTGWSPDTDQVSDASRITPWVTAPGTRSGHDISIEVHVAAGTELRKIESVLHEATVQRRGQQATVRLKNQKTIPNKDFILRYATATNDIGDAVLTHASDRGQFLTLVLQPPRRVQPAQITPKEMVFVLDVSGSMRGEKIEKAKQTMFHCLAHLNPQDTFSFITFSGRTNVLFPAPVPPTDENLQKVKDLLASLKGSGGTEMMTAIRAALDPSDSQKHVRIVCFMTDGLVGNDMAILAEIQKHPNARVFSFGVGQSVNRFLLDNMAKAGRGEVQYVTLGSDGEQVAKRFYERLRNPVLTDITVDWGNLPVINIYPDKIMDLFSSKPVMLHTQYMGAGRGELRLQGRIGGEPFERTIRVDLPKRQPENGVLGSLWARAKVDDLMTQDWEGMQRGAPRSDLKEQIVELGMQYRLVTQFTSFVAVEEMTITEGGEPRTIAVPVEMPEGVTYEGVFGLDARVTAGKSRAGSFRGAALGLMAPTRPQFRHEGLRGPAGPVSFTWGPNQADEFAYGAAELEASIKALEQAEMPAEQKREQMLKLKLAPELHGLAEKVAKEGQDGNLTTDDVVVKDGKVEVSVWLMDDSEENLAKLKELGFVELARAKAVKMIVGTIDVFTLEELALLDCVKRVEPGPK